jgi:Arc/MetJ-type ribon-helix-helix transcriptional regulator
VTSSEKAERQSIRLYDDQTEILDPRIGDGGFENRSEAIREMIEAYPELRSEIDALRENRDALLDEHERERAELEREIDRLENQYRVLVNERQDENLPVPLDRDHALRRYAERQQRRSEQPFYRRWWWRLAGEPELATGD